MGEKLRPKKQGWWFYRHRTGGMVCMARIYETVTWKLMAIDDENACHWEVSMSDQANIQWLGEAVYRGGATDDSPAAICDRNHATKGVSKMTIDELTIGDARDIARMFGPGAASPPVPFELGKAYFIRTCTYHLTGRVTRIVGKFLVLEDAAWIADSGRFAQAIADGTLTEIEPVGTAFVNIEAITDAMPWNHELPKERQ